MGYGNPGSRQRSKKGTANFRSDKTQVDPKIAPALGKPALGGEK
jgi:hypothetical protein